MMTNSFSLTGSNESRWQVDGAVVNMGEGTPAVEHLMSSTFFQKNLANSSVLGTFPLGVLLNIDNRDNRLGATTISIIDIYLSFSIIIDVMTLAIKKNKVDLH